MSKLQHETQGVESADDVHVRDEPALGWSCAPFVVDIKETSGASPDILRTMAGQYPYLDVKRIAVLQNRTRIDKSWRTRRIALME